MINPKKIMCYTCDDLSYFGHKIICNLCDYSPDGYLIEVIFWELL